jgi:predicted DNA-binding WGR domain protein
MVKTRLEFKDEKSQKFWEIDAKGSTINILYGKLGTNGQTSVKKMASAEAAKKEMEKAIKSKLKKGYKKK